LTIEAYSAKQNADRKQANPANKKERATNWPFISKSICKW